MKQLILTTALVALTFPAFAEVKPRECVRPVIGKTGQLLYCTRDLSIEWNAKDCTCRQIAENTGGAGGWSPEVDEPEPVDPVDPGQPVDPVDPEPETPEPEPEPEHPADPEPETPVEPEPETPVHPEPETPTPPKDKGPKKPKTGTNPGNDKPVGNAPWDGVKGEQPSGKPKP